jgi:DNA-directed RNA polymerase specialized sigma24 family protein
VTRRARDDDDAKPPAPARDRAAHGGMTLREIARELGLSPERVRQIEAAALAKLALAVDPSWRPDNEDR